MPQLASWQQSIAVTPFLSLAMTTFATPSPATDKAMPQDINPSPLEPISLQNEENIFLAQAAGECRRVVTRGSNLYVRSSPGGSIIGSLPNRSLVTLETRSSNGWVRISAPVRGYVAGDYLSLCAQPEAPSNIVTPSGNVRRVAAINGLRIRQSPSLNSAVVGSLANGERVIIENRGANGWVPISSPIKGYVSATYLKYSR